MAEDKRIVPKHSVMIDRRENISITGVMDVISFDEENVVVETELGVLIMRGSNFHVSRLNLDNGELEVDGEMSQISYEEQTGYTKGKPSFLGKLFR